MFTSSFRPGELVIDDSNYQQHAGPKNSHEDGRGYERRDYGRVPYGAPASPFPDELLIDEAEWPERIEEMERTKTRLSDLEEINPWDSLDQNGTNYCWFFGCVSAMNFCQSRDSAPGSYVPLSPASGACKVKNFRNQGGWSGEAIEHLAKFGVCPQSMWPQAAINRKYDTPEAASAALNYRATEWYDLPEYSFKHVMSSLLLRFPVPCGFDWWGHLVCLCDPMMRARNDYGLRFRNSWGMGYGARGYGTLFGSKARTGDAIALRVCTTVGPLAN